MTTVTGYLDGLTYGEPVLEDDGRKYCVGCGADLTVPGSVRSLVEPVSDGIYEYECRACPTYWKRDGPRWMKNYLVGGKPDMS